MQTYALRVFIALFIFVMSDKILFLQNLNKISLKKSQA